MLIALAAGSLSCSTIDSKVTVLRVTNWGGAGDDSQYYKTLREIYETFEQRNPGIKIQVEGIPGSQDYVSKVLLSHVAKSAPDVITLDASSAAVFIENGILRDLAPLAQNDPDFSFDNYFPNVVQIASRGEKIYAVPMDFTPMVLYYNKALFDAAGVEYPNADWDYEDFLLAAKKLTNGDHYGLAFANWMPAWILWLWNNGGEVVAEENGEWKSVFASRRNEETVSWIYDLIMVHKIAPSLSATAAQGINFFQDGKAAMEISGHWAMDGYRNAKNLKIDQIGVAPIPTNLESGVTVMYEAGLAIGKNCKHPDAAWKFIQYMSSAEVQRKYHQSGIAVSARLDISKERATDERERAFLQIVKSARPPWGSKVVGYDLVEEVGQKMMDAVLKNGVPPKTALAQAEKRINEELNRK